MTHATIFLYFNKAAEDAAKFYAETFLSNNLHTPTACEVITERSRRGFSARIPFSS